MDLAGIVTSISSEIPISGHEKTHFADNYERGTYEPRNDIYGVDRERSCRRDERDSMDRDSAGVYRHIMEEPRSAEASALSVRDPASP